MSPRAIDYLTTAFGLLDGSMVQSEIKAAAERERDLATIIDTSRPVRILDLANGRLRPQYQLLQAAGHKVYGIDLANYPAQDLIGQAYILARWLFHWHIPNGRKALPAGGLICGDVGRLPFCDSLFDLITSMSAFEHFQDVPSAVAEMHRVLRTSGLAWVRIHPFTSLSGGHNLSFTEIPITKLPHGVEPWDHLRKRKIPFSVPLNEWRIDQYISAFSNYFEILKHYCAVREGQYLLTTEIKEELANYSPDELTCCTYAILARKID